VLFVSCNYRGYEVQVRIMILSVHSTDLCDTCLVVTFVKLNLIELINLNCCFIEIYYAKDAILFMTSN